MPPAQTPSTERSGSHLGNVNDLTKEAKGLSRYDWAEIDATRWCQFYPYQFAVLSVDDKGAYDIYEDMVFTLPVPPESLTLSTPFASTLTATLGGVVEQNGGCPLRDIAISGSFGVLPGSRPTGLQLGSTWSAAGQLSAIAGGTVAAAERTARAATSILGPQYSSNLMNAAEKKQVALERGTGYYQFHKFQRFLESYAELKRTAAGRPLRLALFIWKDKAAYLVKPHAFQVTKNVQSPHEWKYSLSMQAWRRIDPTTTVGNVRPISNQKSVARGASWFGRLAQGIQAVRDTINGARDTINAICSDYEDTVGRTLREVGLAMKDAAGLVKTAGDFPAKIVDSIANDLGTLSGAYSAAANTWNSVTWDKFSGPFTDKKRFNKIKLAAERSAGKKNNTSRSTSPDASASAPSSDADNLGSADSDVQSTLGSIERNGLPVLRNAMRAGLADSIELSTVPMSPATQQMVDTEIERVRSYSQADFRRFRDQAYAFAARFADRVGLGNARYNASMGFATQAAVRSTPTIEDRRVLDALTAAAQVFGRLATHANKTAKTLTPIEYIAGVASTGDIDIRVPRSKFAVPFPYGGSLEQLAVRYLGDAHRWHDIAALNDLREPYIDETGTTAPILVNGTDTELIVADGSALTLGQTVYVQSDEVAPHKRLVLGLEKNPATGYWAVSLSKVSSLPEMVSGQQPRTYASLITVANHTSLHWFSTTTVHGGQLIYIPSDKPETSNFAPSAEDVQKMLEVGDVDGRLTETGDLDIQPNGDWPFTWGVEGIVQWTRTALSTRRGSMVLHPDFGLPIGVGESLADYSAQDALAAIQGMFRDGPKMTEVLSVVVDATAPAVTIGLELGIRGMEARLPISYTLRA